MNDAIKIVCCPDCEGLPVLKLVNGEIGLQCQDCNKEFQFEGSGWKYMHVKVK